MKIAIHPTLEVNAKCPHDQSELDILNVAIPGMRNLAEAKCPKCGSQYYVDLPTGQAIWSPAILDQATAEVYDPWNIHWFSQPLREGFLTPVPEQIVPIVHKFFDSDRIIIVNCLDFLYGHSLLKLLNLQSYLDQGDGVGCCILVPTQLKHLVPDGVAEIWEFPIAIKEGHKWYPSLQAWINQQIQSRKECFLSPVYSHPHYETYDLNRFVRNLPDISEEIRAYEPIILFSYREDRLWGRSLMAQQRNLQRLYHQLCTVFPKLAFVLVGFGQQNQINPDGGNLIDLRVTQFSIEQDQLWMAYMKAADCSIGIHGSNMLLPSGLGKSTLELMPRSRIGNSVQDFLFSQNKSDVRDALLQYRMLYGNENLSNIQPSTVVDLVANLLSHSSVNSRLFKMEIPKTSTDLKTITQSKSYAQAAKHLQLTVKKSIPERLIKRMAEILLDLQG
jgi:hypothetical protein